MTGGIVFFTDSWLGLPEFLSSLLTKEESAWNCRKSANQRRKPLPSRAIISYEAGHEGLHHVFTDRWSASIAAKRLGGALTDLT